MTVGLAPATANAWLNWLVNQTTAGTSPAAIWIQLHTADPGLAGTTAVAGNATRKNITASFPAASGNTGIVSNDVAISWTAGEVDTAEDYTHWALFDASTTGTFLCSGLMTANAVLVGDEFTIPIGDLDLSLSVTA